MVDLDGMANQDKAADEIATPKNNHDQKKNMLNRIWAKYFDGKSAGWTAAFTGILTLFTFLLAWIASTSNDVAIQTQRAFINVSSVSGQKIVGSDGKVVGLAFAIGITNSGTTPTKTASGMVNMQPRSVPLPDSFDFRDLSTTSSLATVVGPKETPTFNVVTVPLDDLVATGSPRNHHVYTWGWIVYRDTFKNTPLRLTEFCREIVGFTAHKIGTSVATPMADIADSANEYNWGIIPCPVTHNCYDEDCKDYNQRVKAN